MRIAGCLRHRIWLLTLVILLMAPSSAVLAESTTQDSLIITASVSSLIVADISGGSATCTLFQPDKHDKDKDKHKKDKKNHHKRGSAWNARSGHGHDRDHDRHTDPVYCVLKLPLSLHVLSNEQWSVSLRAVDTGGTKAPSVQACSLRFSTSKPTRYRDAAAGQILGSSPTPWLKNQSAGESSAGVYLILASPEKSKIGAFSARVTITATQKHSGLQYSIIVPVTFRPG